MKPPPPHDVRAEGIYCLEACVAALMEVSPREVPDVHAVARDLEERGEDVIGWWGPLLEWLWKRGYTVCEWLFIEHGPPQGWSIAVGPSPRSESTHAVVAKDGELFWDPYLDHPVGLPEGVGRYWVLEKL